MFCSDEVHLAVDLQGYGFLIQGVAHLRAEINDSINAGLQRLLCGVGKYNRRVLADQAVNVGQPITDGRGRSRAAEPGRQQRRGPGDPFGSIAGGSRTDGAGNLDGDFMCKLDAGGKFIAFHGGVLLFSFYGVYYAGKREKGQQKRGKMYKDTAFYCVCCTKLFVL